VPRTAAGTHPLITTEDTEVDVTAGSGETWVSVTGQTAMVDDGKKRDLRNSGVAAWLPQGAGRRLRRADRGGRRVRRVLGRAGGRLATALSFVKAEATGQRIDAGENARPAPSQRCAG
jgi:hypothetical protein